MHRSIPLLAELGKSIVLSDVMFDSFMELKTTSKFFICLSYVAG